MFNNKLVLFLFLSAGWAPAIAQISPLKASIDKGKIVFEQQCLACHQVDGSGVPHLNPPLIKTSFVLGDKRKLVGIVLNGLDGVDIDGDSYSNPMPALGAALSDQEIADVLTYVRNSFGNKASIITVMDVKKVRTAAKK